MAVQEVDDQGNFWFLSASDSNKNQELQADDQVQPLFQGSAHSDFLRIVGKATISTDKARIHELRNPILKAWFTEGVDDPRITIIQGGRAGRLLLGHQARQRQGAGEDGYRGRYRPDPARLY